MLKRLFIWCLNIVPILLFSYAGSVYAGSVNNQVAENQYIVVLKDRKFSLAASTNATGETVAQVAERLINSAQQNQVNVDMQKGVTPSLKNASVNLNNLGFVYEKAIKGFSATLTSDAAQFLKNNPEVDYVEQDYVVTVDAVQASTPSWGLDRIDQRDLPLNQSYQYITDGSNVHVYVLDTGVRATHNEFVGRVGNGYDFIDNDSNPDDCYGHGTHVAGTASGVGVGVAKNSIIHPVRVLNCQGSGLWSQIIAGVDWVAKNHISPSVANMSLGGDASQAVDTAVTNAINAGVTFVVSAGNDSGGDACNKSPARVPNAITVASSTSLDQRSSFSNIGTCVDIFAPGSDIWSSMPPNAYINSTCYENDGGGYGFCSGTSMASPHVAGAVALYLQSNVSASPAQVASAIIGDSIPNKIADAGAGTPNRLLSTLNFAWLILPVFGLNLF